MKKKIIVSVTTTYEGGMALKNNLKNIYIQRCSYILKILKYEL